MISKKLAEVQAVIEQPNFDSRNPHFKSQFASLAECNRVVLDAVRKVGECAFFQRPRMADDMTWLVDTVFVADGSEAVLASVPFNRDANPQKMGSGITYARRYSLCAAFCLVAEEDDDANVASEPKQVQKTGYARVEKAPSFMELCKKATDEFFGGDMDKFQAHLKETMGMDPRGQFDKSRLEEGKALVEIMLKTGTANVSQTEMEF